MEGGSDGGSKGPANLPDPCLSHVVIMLMSYSTILIAGGGIIGNSISYYLAKRTGEAITELLMDGKTSSVDLNLFDVSSRK
jgi:hypothetical protein